MIAVAIVLAAQGVPQSMLAAADEANAAFVQCLFAVSRAANGARLGADEFERKLGSSCLAEEAAVVRTGIIVLRRRGVSDPESTVRREAQDARRSVLDTYRKGLEFRP